MGLKILGITDDVTTCDACGRDDLKRTVILGRTDADGNVMDVVHFGTDCAARATLLRRTARAVEALAEQAQRDADRELANRVIEVGTDPSDPQWVVEAIGSNGGSADRLCFARGLRSAVRDWARATYPNREINVRRPI